MKKRILITNGHLNVGGVEKSLINFLHSVDYSRYEIDLLLFESLGDYLNDVPDPVNVILCDLTKTYGSFLHVVKNNLKSPETVYKKIILTMARKCSSRFYRLLRKSTRYDAAIAYRVGMPLDYVSYGVHSAKKYFWWHHGEFNYPDTQVHQWQTAAMNMNGMICVSESIKKVVEPHFKPYVKNILVIPNSLNISELIRKSAEYSPYDDKMTHIVSVGRFSEEKHMIDCVDVAERLISEGFTDFRWYLIGDGAEWDRIQRHIHELDLNRYIVCTGRMSNPYPYIRNADLIVHPSFVESQGLTVLESMALGQLTVCTASDGVLEFAMDGRNAILAEKNTGSLYRSVKKAVEMDMESAGLIKACAKETARNFACNIIWNRIEDILLKDV